MKIKPYIEKLNKSKVYKDFQNKYDDAFMVAGFFILDFESGNNIHQIDYYVPSAKKIAAFTLDDKIKMQLLDMMKTKVVPEKLDIQTKVDLDALHGILDDEMKNRNMTDEIKKIIAIIQTIEGKKIWNLNCVLSGMGILKAHVEDESQTVLKMEKSSILDYVKKLPAGMLPQKGKGIPGQPGKEIKVGGSPQTVPQEDTKEEIQEKIKTLDKVEKEIEKEKELYEKELAKKSKKKKVSKK